MLYFTDVLSASPLINAFAPTLRRLELFFVHQEEQDPSFPTALFTAPFPFLTHLRLSDLTPTELLQLHELGGATPAPLVDFHVRLLEVPPAADPSTDQTLRAIADSLEPFRPTLRRLRLVGLGIYPEPGRILNLVLPASYAEIEDLEMRSDLFHSRPLLEELEASSDQKKDLEGRWDALLETLDSGRRMVEEMREYGDARGSETMFDALGKLKGL